MYKNTNGANSTDRRNNNYIDYFSSSSLSIHKHVDVFKLSIKDEYSERFIDKQLKANGFKVKDYALKKGNYRRKREYRSSQHNVKVDLLYKLKDERRFLPALLLHVHDPDLEFMQLMKSVFFRYGIEAKLSLVELAFDFYTGDKWELFLFFKEHLYLKHQRTRSNERRYETTYYANDIRRSVYGVKVYFRIGNKFVRVELTLKSKKLREQGINSLLEGIENIDLARFFSFKVFNEKQLLDYLLGKYKHDIAAAQAKNPCWGNLVVAHIDGWLQSAVNCQESLMWKVELLKSERGVAKYLDYFSDYEEFNEAFRNTVSSQTFIKSRRSV